MIPVTYYVSRKVSCPILGQNECEALHLVQRIFQSSSKADNREKVIEQYQDVFTGQGTFGESYHIDADVVPVAQPPRKIPHSRLHKLREALDEMRKGGIITDMREPAKWVSNLVMSEKKNGKLRICLDPKPLNKAIIREPFPAPTLHYVQSKLTGKKVFSVLDQSSSFWQVKLSEESSMLCTFNTPWGRMRFLRMPFGMRSASDILQRRNYETFGDIQDTHIMVDDTVVAGETDGEHDEVLETVLGRAREKESNSILQSSNTKYRKSATWAT